MRSLLLKTSYIITFTFCLFLRTPSHADQVIFKSGRCLDCKIIGETADSVEVTLDSGTIQISKTQLKKWERTANASSKQPKTQSYSPTVNILHPEHAPTAHSDLAVDFQRLAKKRNAAVDAKYMMNYYALERVKVENADKKRRDQVEQLNQEYALLSGQVATIAIPEKTPSSNKEVRILNELITKKNKLEQKQHALVVEIQKLEDSDEDTPQKIQQLELKRKACVAPIALYQKALPTFRETYNKRKRTLPENPDQKTIALFQEIDRHLLRFTHEMPSIKIASKQVGSSTVVRALINGSVAGDFVFDTGASLMTISESFAQKLGIPLSSLPSTTMVVADGRLVHVKRGNLVSVAVGQAEVANVEVVIVADSPNNKTDGLLGMSFLKHFVTSIHGETGIIELMKILEK